MKEIARWLVRESGRLLQNCGPGSKGLKFRRQHPIDRFIVDFYGAEAALVIEVDGPIHEYSPEQDAIRQEFLESFGLCILRLTNDRVMDDGEYVHELQELRRAPSTCQ